MPKSGEKEQYRQQYPGSEKWLQQCLICQTIGYKPEMPEKVGVGFLAQNIRMFYPKLLLNELGLCEDCERHYKS